MDETNIVLKGYFSVGIWCQNDVSTSARRIDVNTVIFTPYVLLIKS